MDKLTLIALAHNQPRRAVHFQALGGDDIADSKAYGSRECAACCYEVNERSSAITTIGELYQFVTLGVRLPGTVGVVTCAHCSLPLEYE